MTETSGTEPSGAPTGLPPSTITAMALYDFESCRFFFRIVSLLKVRYPAMLLNSFLFGGQNCVQFSFLTAQDDELAFKAGDHIVDIAKFDEAWWSGRIGDRVGIFPSNHVSED